MSPTPEEEEAPMIGPEARGQEMARVARRVGMREIRNSIRELEEKPRWELDALGMSNEYRLNAARIALSKLEEADSADPG